MIYDVVIVGAGVTGAFIARELSRYQLNVCLVDRAEDVAMGSSKANSGIVHAGYDPVPGSLKARFNVRGNQLMESVCRELDVPFKRTGSLVLAFDAEDMRKLQDIYERGLKNGVPDLEIWDATQVKKAEPAVADNVSGALYAPTGGIVCPYELTLGAAENAVKNGVVLKLGCEIKSIEFKNGIFLLHGSGEVLEGRYVINAAGVYADRISAMVGDDSFSIIPRKGEYLLMDKNQGSLVNRVIFQTPSRMGKGVLVSPTVDGNLLVGPNAVDIQDKEDLSTSKEGLNQVKESALRSVPGIDMSEVITSFAGLRAKVVDGDDFIIGPSSKNDHFINVAGIDSPGLTSAPAIAEHVIDILGTLGLEMKEKESFNPVRRRPRRFTEMSEAEINERIRTNPAYGRIICRCEKVSEGEIIDCIRSTIGARTLDGVKRRVRAGMGRCQGGFCAPRVVEILSRELQIPMETVTKRGGDSRILMGKIKQQEFTDGSDV